MSYSRDEVKAITDKVLDMCKADAVEVDFSGGERAATRYANSSITANLIENDQEIQITEAPGADPADRAAGCAHRGRRPGIFGDPGGAHRRPRV